MARIQLKVNFIPKHDGVETSLQCKISTSLILRHMAVNTSAVLNSWGKVL